MKQLVIFSCILIFGFGGIFAASRFLEKNKPATDEQFADEDLYFSSARLNSFGYDFRGLIADWYWISSLQYLGDKIVKAKRVDINDLRPLKPRLLYPMLDAATTLDPQFTEVYSYGASVLPAIDETQAVKLLEKGIAANPDNWRLYHNLGYIYWREKNYARAAEIYGEGAKKPDAPAFMQQMSANMQAQGGDREFAREIYRQMFETAGDEQTKNFAELRFQQIVSLDERDAIRAVLQNFAEKNKRCANSWTEISRELRPIKINGESLNFDQSGAPLDPTGTAYLLNNQTGACDVSLSRDSIIPQV